MVLLRILEYGLGCEMSTQGDVYSFGILVLEMLTGRSPTDKTFKDGQNLHNLVKVAFPENILQILDPLLVPRETDDAIEEEIKENLTNVENYLVTLFQIGLACSMESLKERMNMVNVIRQLNVIRKVSLVGGIKENQFYSPFPIEEQYRGATFTLMHLYSIPYKLFHISSYISDVETFEEFNLKSAVKSIVEMDEYGDKSAAEMDVRNKGEHLSTTDLEEGIITIG